MDYRNLPILRTVEARSRKSSRQPSFASQFLCVNSFEDSLRFHLLNDKEAFSVVFDTKAIDAFSLV
jgi:hypothetical protein